MTNSNLVNEGMTYNEDEILDPSAERQTEEGKRNYAKVGSARPSSLLYTYGPGAIMDLPNFSVMPAGLDDWNRVFENYPDSLREIDEKRLLAVTQLHLGPQVKELRSFPWQAQRNFTDQSGRNVGVPSRVFPQWFRCTGCNMLAPLTLFSYSNTNPFKPYEADFRHKECPNKGGQRQGRLAVPAQFLLTCSNGHLDEFPYDLWVHGGSSCPEAEVPHLKMTETNMGRNVGSIIGCSSCGAKRAMSEAQGSNGEKMLPQKCRGRHPHLNAFDKTCDARVTLIMMGASNLWFPVTQSVVVMPRSADEKKKDLADELIKKLGESVVKQFAQQIDVLKTMAQLQGIDASQEELAEAASKILEEPAESEALEEKRQEKLEKWEPTDLLVPEWNFLQKPISQEPKANDGELRLHAEQLPDTADTLHLSKVIAVDKMKRVNAFVGFTRLDEVERAGDKTARIVKLTRDHKPTWVPATVDRGEGVYLQFDLEAVKSWEDKIENSELWAMLRSSHERNFRRRISETSEHNLNPDDRLPAPRYWLLHSLSHALIRQMSIHSGYGAASLSERIYAWKEDSEKDRKAAAGILISTTASDSEGTLGGLVSLAKPSQIEKILHDALYRSCRCSSDPVCATRVPYAPEDFLHGAACHNCSFASETSCERANRFLDRRFLITLPNNVSKYQVDGFFGTVNDIF